MRQIPTHQWLTHEDRMNRRSKRALNRYKGGPSVRLLHYAAEQQRRLIERERRLTEIGYDLLAMGWVGSNADLAHCG